MNLPDIQDQADDRGVDIDEVGVAGVRTQVAFADGSLKQSGIATCALTVGLPRQRRGTHMSRMIELIDRCASRFDPRELGPMLKAAASRLDVETVELTVTLPVAVRVSAPATGLQGWQPADVSIAGRLDLSGFEVLTTVTAEVTSLCPCSKEISAYGAHNQRSEIRLAVAASGDMPYPLPIADAIALIRTVGSAPVYPIVKRPDERVITMQAYDHPTFVEDMVRDLSLVCSDRELRHSVAIRNMESIHSHDAVARIDRLSLSALPGATTAEPSATGA